MEIKFNEAADHCAKSMQLICVCVLCLQGEMGKSGERGREGEPGIKVLM